MSRRSLGVCTVAVAVGVADAVGDVDVAAAGVGEAAQDGLSNRAGSGACDRVRARSRAGARANAVVQREADAVEVGLEVPGRLDFVFPRPHEVVRREEGSDAPLEDGEALDAVEGLERRNGNQAEEVLEDEDAEDDRDEVAEEGRVRHEDGRDGQVEERDKQGGDVVGGVDVCCWGGDGLEAAVGGDEGKHPAGRAQDGCVEDGGVGEAQLHEDVLRDGVRDAGHGAKVVEDDGCVERAVGDLELGQRVVEHHDVEEQVHQRLVHERVRVEEDALVLDDEGVGAERPALHELCVEEGVDVRAAHEGTHARADDGQRRRWQLRCHQRPVPGEDRGVWGDACSNHDAGVEWSVKPERGQRCGRAAGVWPTRPDQHTARPVFSGVSRFVCATRNGQRGPSFPPRAPSGRRRF